MDSRVKYRVLAATCFVLVIGAPLLAGSGWLPLGWSFLLVVVAAVFVLVFYFALHRAWDDNPHGLTAGRIIEKQRIPAHFEVHRFPFADPIRVPVAYRFRLQNSEGQTGWLDVSEADYDAHEIGEWYTHLTVV